MIEVAFIRIALLQHDDYAYKIILNRNAGFKNESEIRRE